MIREIPYYMSMKWYIIAHAIIIWRVDICDTVDTMDFNSNVACSGDILWMFILQVTDVVRLYYRTEAVQHQDYEVTVSHGE